MIDEFYGSIVNMIDVFFYYSFVNRVWLFFFSLSRTVVTELIDEQPTDFEMETTTSPNVNHVFFLAGK